MERPRILSAAEYFFIIGISVLVCIPSPAHSQPRWEWSPSTVDQQRGHYPGNMCLITNAVLNSNDGVFYYNSPRDLHSSQCDMPARVWTMRHEADPSRFHLEDCSEVYDVGYVYTIFYYGKGSNYFHLHWDMLLPLYQELFRQERSDVQKKLVFMPSVETTRLNSIDWNTPAFNDFDRYWVQMSKFLAEGHSFIPLNRFTLDHTGNICFRQIKFGTPRIDYRSRNLVQGYVKHAKKQFGIEQSIQVTDRVGIISRKNRRRILNEQKLVSAVDSLAKTELVTFDGMSFQEQVEAMQKYTVLVGMNGAGLMNCIYLADNGVCIQLVPHNCATKLNFKEYGKLLAARGPYLEWHNKHPELHIVPQHSGDDAQAATIVEVDEFVDLVKKALMMSARHIRDRDEL